MSWDNNNLACILMFPPWQKKGLGANLIGVSYSIARREGIMGGPEKPISEMGQKGYKRYWGTEIARWILTQEELELEKGKKKSKAGFSIQDISQATWIAPEDVLATMREWNVVQKDDKGKGKPEDCIVDPDAVAEWVEKKRISLEWVVDEDGFLPGYAEKKKVGSEEVEE